MDLEQELKIARGEAQGTNLVLLSLCGYLSRLGEPFKSVVSDALDLAEQSATAIQMGNVEGRRVDLVALSATIQGMRDSLFPAGQESRADPTPDVLGKTTLNKGFSSNVIAGDDTLGQLWLVDPTRALDNDGSGGEVEFPREVIGALPVRGRESVQCGAVYLVASVGNPALTGDAVTLETSDDSGNTWTSQGSNTVTAGNVSQELSWIGLGLMTAPGRLFRITDSGALSRISSLDMPS